MKPLILYCPKDPEGRVMIHSLHETRYKAIEAAEDSIYYWKDLRKSGWRIVKVRVEEVG